MGKKKSISDLGQQIPANELWRELGRTERQRYIVSPCQGATSRTYKAKPGHLYEVQDCGDKIAKSMGFMSFLRALRTFGVRSMFISESHVICPKCAKYLEAASVRAAKKLKKKYSKKKRR